MIKLRRMKWAYMKHGWERRGMHICYGAKPEGRKSLGRPRHRWVYNTEMDLGEIGWGGMNWICLSQNRDEWNALVNVVMNLWVPCVRERGRWGWALQLKRFIVLHLLVHPFISCKLLMKCRAFLGGGGHHGSHLVPKND
jgi:hypothetical protein